LPLRNSRGSMAEDDEFTDIVTNAQDEQELSQQELQDRGFQTKGLASCTLLFWPIRSPVILSAMTKQGSGTCTEQARFCWFRNGVQCGSVRSAPCLLFQENTELTKQNNANNTRASRRSIIVGKAKIMSYEDVDEAIKKREEKDTAQGKGPGRKGKKSGLKSCERKKSREEEIESAHRELEREEWGVYGSVF
jgi:hypothetical protein